jgi:anti-sigma regulatory factor (Ser/Thr protein kinase)
MTDSVQTEVTMESRLSEMPALIQRLRSDPELLSRIRGREADFLIAMREALANAVTHGNHSDASKRVFISYACEANETLSIVVRDEGNGFDPIHLLSPNEIPEDQKRGISLIGSSMDEVQFRKNGTEIYMRMNRRKKQSP